MNDNRLTGILLVVLAALFLWLYDTGRWDDISDILAGRAPKTTVYATANGATQGTGSNPLTDLIGTLSGLFKLPIPF